MSVSIRAIVIGCLLFSTASWGADVSWVPNANGNWNLEANWSGGEIPGSADNVTIDTPGDITVTVDARAVTVGSLTSEEDLVITGQRFTVGNVATVNGAMDLQAATLTAQGATAVFNGAGPVTAVDTIFSASGGGSMLLSTLAETNFSEKSANWIASGNGTMDFPILSNIAISNSGRFTADAQGSSIDLSALTTLDNANVSRSGFAASGADGNINLNTLTAAHGAFFRTTAAAVLDLPSLASYDATTANVIWSANGADSALNFPNLTAIQTMDTGNLTVQAENAANVDLSSLATFQNSTASRSTLRVSGAGSQLDLSSLSSANDVAFSAVAGGNMQLPALASYEADGRNVIWDSTGSGSRLAFTALTSMSSTGTARLSINATGGGQVDMNELTEFNNVALSRNVFSATGVGSQVHLDELASANDLGFTVGAGGVIRMPKMETFETSSNIIWDAMGNGSELAIPNLDTIQASGTGRITVQTTNGKIDLSKLTTVSNPENSRLAFSSTGRDGSIDLSSLQSARSLGLAAIGGSVLNAPALTEYTVEGTAIWSAAGLGSQLKVGSITNLEATEVGRLTVDATGGGMVDLSKLTTFANPVASNRNLFNATGTNSMIDLSSLNSAQLMTFSAANGGSIDLSQLTNAANSAFNVTGEVTHTILPALAEYTTDTRSITWNVSGFDSSLSFPAMTTMTASGGGRLAATIGGGSSLNLNALTTVENPDSNAVSFAATGLATSVDFSSLETASFVAFSVANGATMDLSNLSAPVNSSFAANGGSELVLPALQTYTANEKNPAWGTSGAGGRLAFPALTQISVVDNSGFAMGAQSGGELDLSMLTTIEHLNTRQVTVTSSGVNSQVRLDSLVTAPFVAFEANQGGAMSLSSLSSATESSFIVRSGSQLSLDALASFEVATRAVNWAVSDFGSQLSFPVLSSIAIPTRGSVGMQVTNGGKLDISSLTVVENPENRDVSLSAVGPGSLIDASSLTMFPGSLIDARAGATIQLSPEITTLQSTNLIVRSTGTINAGTIRLEDESRIIGDGTLNANVDNANGIVASGFSPAVLTIDGSYLQSELSSLEMEILGPNLGAEYDHLAVTGEATLSGNLSILVGGYTPDAGELFHLIDAPQGISGLFMTISSGDVGNGIGFAPVYEAGRMLVRASLTGDTDLDGSVNFADFLQLSGNFGNAADWSTGDFDGDGTAGFSDFLALSSNFGRSEAAAASVPEPAANVCVGLLCLAITRVRRRRG